MATMMNLGGGGVKRVEWVTWTPNWNADKANYDITVGGGKPYNLKKTVVVGGDHLHQVSSWSSSPNFSMGCGAYMLDNETVRVVGKAIFGSRTAPTHKPKFQIIEFISPLKSIQVLKTPSLTGGTINFNRVNLTKSIFYPTYLSGYFIYESCVHLGTVTETSLEIIQPYGYSLTDEYRWHLVEFA